MFLHLLYMSGERLFLILTICAVLACAALVLYPLADYVFLALLLSYFLLPFRRSLQRNVRSRSLSSLILILVILLFIILPIVYIGPKLVREITSGWSLFTHSPDSYLYLEKMGAQLQHFSGQPIDLHSYKLHLLNEARSFLLRTAPNFLGSMSEMLLGLFVMFFVMFYSLQEGRAGWERIHPLIPLSPNLKEKVFGEFASLARAVVYGQVMMAMLQGLLGGLGFFFLGLPNPVLWGFVMLLLSFLPIIGTAIVWLPASILLMISGETWRGIGLLLYFVVAMNIDTFLKPHLISARSKVHPVVALLGVFGGLKLFGFIGLFAGPLILALVIALIRLYEDEYLERQARHEAA